MTDAMLSAAPELTVTDARLDGVASTAVAPEPAPSAPGSSPEESESDLDQPIRSGWLLKFALPTIMSTVAMSSFGIIDGIFAARIIGPAAFASTGIAFPLLSFFMAVGLMLSIGGSALVAKRLGEGRSHEARSIFTMLTVVTGGSAVVMSAFGLLFPDLLLAILGADAHLGPLVLEYVRPMLFVGPLMMLGFFMQQYFITEGKPNLGFAAVGVGGVVNIGLNFLLIWHLDMGLHGAALATGIGYSVPALFGVLYFSRNRRGTLYFIRPRWSARELGQASVNGASEMVTMLAISVTTVIMNNILMETIGYQSVAAASIMFVGQNLLMSTFMGFATGIAPIISFNYGAQNRDRLRRLFTRALWIIAGLAVAAIAAGWFLASPLTIIYVPRTTEIYSLAVHAFRISLVGFIFMGVNMFASVMFTALNNGVVSGILSLFRTLIFLIGMLMLLPNLLGADGVWLSIPAAEALGVVMSLAFFAAMAKRYGYAGKAPTT